MSAEEKIQNGLKQMSNLLNGNHYEVYVFDNNMRTPKRFWEYALIDIRFSNYDITVEYYKSLGYTLSENDTKDYNEYSDEMKSKCRFSYINDKNQLDLDTPRITYYENHRRKLNRK